MHHLRAELRAHRADHHAHPGTDANTDDFDQHMLTPVRPGNRGGSGSRLLRETVLSAVGLVPRLPSSRRA